MHLPGPNFFRVKGEKARMLEIGVQSGGSAVAWKKFFTDSLYYVGLDIDPRCSRSRDEPNNVFIEIGSQMDTAFLDSVCKKHGPFDVIIDDGGHTTAMMSITLDHMLRNPLCLVQRGGLYVVEDTHVLAKCGKKGHCAAPTDITNIFAKVWEQMHYPYDNALGPVSMSMYRAMVFIQLGEQEKEIEVKRGTDGFNNLERQYNAPGAYLRPTKR
mmetsp:Transcript_12977/g.30323  ORF Transcript_12977/g.30323 Transcript_12977/m.30323 type:complete len:213 (-) Transcript_12977:117-755(-)